MTKRIVIQIEQIFSRDYSRVCEEYKANFKICLNYYQSMILITSAPNILLLVYSQFFFLVQDMSLF